MGSAEGLWPASRGTVRFRAWTFKLKPFQDELLSSWLIRVAFAHGQNPYVFHNLHLPGVPIWNRDVDRVHPAGLLEALSAVSGAGVRRIKAASLFRYRSLGPRAPAHGEWPFVLAAGVYHRKRRRHGLQFCPDCLGSGTPYFRRSWRLAFVLRCESCSKPLSDACPHCDAPLAPHRAFSDLKICHRCGGNVCNAPGVTGTGPALADGGMQALLTRVAGQAAVNWLGSLLRPSDALLAATVLNRLMPAKRIAICRSAIGLSACPAPLSSERLERQRIGERAIRLETISQWASDWPRNFRRGASALGLTRRSFSGTSIPAPLAAEVARLPAGQTRPRGARPLVLGPELRAIRRRSQASYRSLRARRILERAAPR